MSCATPILPSGPLGHVPEMTGHVAEIAGHHPEAAGHVRPKYAHGRGCVYLYRSVSTRTRWRILDEGACPPALVTRPLRRGTSAAIRFGSVALFGNGTGTYPAIVSPESQLTSSRAAGCCQHETHRIAWWRSVRTRGSHGGLFEAERYEPPRIWWRLQFLRKWSYEQVEQIFC